MFKKLFKHELASYMRKLLPVYIAILGISVIGRLVQTLESETTIYYFLFGSVILGYFIALIGAPIVISILCIVRFYKNLFSDEGYLSFTLPVTTAQHLWCKLLGATTVEVTTFVVSLVSIPIILDTEMFPEVLKAVCYLSKKATEAVGGYFIVYIIDVLVILLLSSMASTLLIYACICLGQRARKGRIVWAVGIYFIYYVATQTLMSFLSIVIPIVFETGGLEGIVSFIETRPQETMHIMFLTAIFVQFIQGTVCYIICHTTIKNKLNLE